MNMIERIKRAARGAVVVARAVVWVLAQPAPAALPGTVMW